MIHCVFLSLSGDSENFPVNKVQLYFHKGRFCATVQTVILTVSHHFLNGILSRLFASAGSESWFQVVGASHVVMVLLYSFKLKMNFDSFGHLFF